MVGKPGRMKLLVRTRRRWEGNIKIDTREMIASVI
jgi:hypothetical protein